MCFQAKNCLIVKFSMYIFSEKGDSPIDALLPCVYVDLTVQAAQNK